MKIKIRLSTARHTPTTMFRFYLLAGFLVLRCDSKSFLRLCKSTDLKSRQPAISVFPPRGHSARSLVTKPANYEKSVDGQFATLASRGGAHMLRGVDALLAVLAVSTLVAYRQRPCTDSSNDKGVNFAAGMLYSCLALVGNTSVSACRKLIARHNVGNAQQVGIASLIQSCGACIYVVYTGDFARGLTRSFWFAAISSSR